MTGSELVLVDSSAWIETIRQTGDRRYGRCVGRLLAEERAATCEVIVAEILQGAISERDLSELSGDLQAMVPLSMAGAGEAAGRLAWRLRQRGIRIEITDLLIAATARIHDAALLHRDKHLTAAAEALELRVIDVDSD